MKKAVLFDSNTGNTKAMAEAVACGVHDAGDDLYFCNLSLTVKSNRTSRSVGTSPGEIVRRVR